MVLEAMAAGKPVIVADHGGPAETVTDDVGIRLPVESPAALTDGLVSAIRRLHDDEPLRQRMGRRARRHVERHYTWAAKAESAIRIYRHVACGDASRAAMSFPGRFGTAAH